MDKRKSETFRQQKMGANNPNWKGDGGSIRTGNDRARRWNPGGHPYNAPENIIFLCRRHHMEEDGRLAKLTKRNKRSGYDLKGKEFGRLKVIGLYGKDPNGNLLWNCICICGTRTIAQSKRLRNGNTRSCGCFQKETARRLLQCLRTHDARYAGN